MSCPSPLPVLPHVVRKVPVFVNFWMRSLFESATKTFPLPSTATPKGRANCPSPLPELPHVVRKVPVFVNFWLRALSWLASKTFPLPSPLPELPHVVRNLPQPGKQAPLMLGFSCLQSFAKLRQVFRCAACIFRQAFFSAFVPVQSLFGGTSARQLLLSCLQSLRQWLGFAATPPARIRLRPTVATASAARDFFSVIRDSPTSAHANFALLDLLQFFAVR